MDYAQNSEFEIMMRYDTLKTKCGIDLVTLGDYEKMVLILKYGNY